jgi:hypothetical protein
VVDGVNYPLIRKKRKRVFEIRNSFSLFFFDLAEKLLTGNIKGIVTAQYFKGNSDCKKSLIIQELLDETSLMFLA